jgi:hypothetical protein
MVKDKPPAESAAADASQRDLEQRRPGQRHVGLRPLGESLGRVVKPLVKDRPLAETQLLLDWTSVVGEELAALARPLKVRFDRPAERLGGVLELACDGGAALELQHRAPLLIERVNAWLGYPAIARLRLKQVTRPKPAAAPPPPRPARARPLPPAPPLPSTGDEGLDAALLRLRDAVRCKAAKGQE